MPEKDVHTDGSSNIGGGVNTGSGDFARDKTVHGDEVQGDKVSGDKITVGNVSPDAIVAVGYRAGVTVIKQATPPASPTPQFLVPFLRNQDFVGRDDELQALHIALCKGETVGVRPAMLTGLGGIGKTQLAVEYVHRFRDSYPGGVYWVNAAQDWQDELAKLAGRVGLRADDAPESDRRHRLVLAFVDFLNAHPDALLIFDNVQDPRLLRTPALGFIPTELKCHLLFTSRRRDPDLPFKAIEVRVLPELTALELLLSAPSRHETLQRIQSSSTDPEREDACAICRSLGYLPLALALSAAYLGKYPKISLSGYRKRLEKEGGLATVDASDVDPLDLPTRHDAAVAATLKSQWDALQSNNARCLLQIAALLGKAVQIPRARLSLLSGLADEVEEGYHAPLDEALIALRELWFIEELTEYEIRLHPLVGEFAEGTIPDQASLAETCAARMADTLWNMDRLNTQVATRGVDAVIADLRSALKLSPLSREGPGRRLSGLLRPLDLEAHHLRGWNPNHQPGFLLQQFRNRCLKSNASELLDRVEAQLEMWHFPYLRECFKVDRESEALIRNLAGHMKVVTGVAFTPDSRFIVSASADRTLRIWDITTGQAVKTLESHTESVISVAVTPNGRYAVCGSADRTLKIWDLDDGQIVRTLEGHQNTVTGVAVTSDGRFAVSMSTDGTCNVWDLANGQILRTFIDHRAPVTGLALTRDDRLVVSMSMDGSLTIWNFSNGEAIWRRECFEQSKPFMHHISSALHEITVTPDGRFAVTPSDGNALKVWDLATGQTVKALEGHVGSVTSVAVAPDGRHAVSASKDNTLRVWDLDSGQLIRILSHTVAEIVAIAPDGRHVATASWDGTIKVWDLTIAQSLDEVYDGHMTQVLDLAATPDNCFAVSASADHTLKVWDLATGHVVRTLEGHTDTVRSVAVTPDGQFIVSASHDGTLKVWDFATGQTIQTLSYDEQPVDVVAVTSNHVISACGVHYWHHGRECVDQNLKIWDLITGQVVGTLEGHTAGVDCVAVTADERFAISASDDMTLKVWDLATRQCIQTLAGHTAKVARIAVTHDGRFAISSHLDNTVKVWDLATKHATWTLEGHTNVVYDVAATPDGRFAISVSSDCTLRIWELATGQLIQTFATNAPLLCCAFTPDGRKILVGDAAGAMHFVEWVKGDDS